MSTPLPWRQITGPRKLNSSRKVSSAAPTRNKGWRRSRVQALMRASRGTLRHGLGSGRLRASIKAPPTGRRGRGHHMASGSIPKCAACVPDSFRRSVRSSRASGPCRARIAETDRRKGSTRLAGLRCDFAGEPSGDVASETSRRQPLRGPSGVTAPAKSCRHVSTEQIIVKRLDAGWELRPKALAYLPAGCGSYRWLARTEDGPRYF